jgi:hypothetical protein
MHSEGVTEDEWKLLECLQAAPAPLKDFLEAKAAEPSPFWGRFVRLADGSQVWRQQGIGGSSAQ